MITKIERRVILPCKLEIFLGEMGISEIFTLRPPNWRSDDKEEKQDEKDYFKASNSVLQIGHLLGSNAVLREFYTNSSKVSLTPWATNN